MRKTALSYNVEESFRNFLDSDPRADDFPNLISFFTVQRYTDELFMKIGSVVFT